MLLPLLFLPVLLAIDHPDLVHDLPGLIFEPDFKTFSGYLRGNEEGTFRLHYMLFESRGKPSTDPLIVWFNGGPGCSSMYGAFTELGPFFPLPDGSGLFENIYAWNQNANLMILESPVNVGLSYATVEVPNSTYNDADTARMNALGLKDFFERVHPNYQGSDLYVAGESYAGVYVPALAAELVRMINNSTFPTANFKGMAIGNGQMNLRMNVLSQFVFNIYRGYYPMDVWIKAKERCNVTEEFLYRATDAQLICLGYQETSIAVYNMKQYPIWHVGMRLLEVNYHVDQGCFNHNIRDFFHLTSTNPAEYFWHDSSDRQRGFPCWFLVSQNVDNPLSTYINKPETRKALNIPDAVDSSVGLCSGFVRAHYNVSEDTTEYFQTFLNDYQEDFRILIYSGDADAIVPFIGTAWFLRELKAKENLTNVREHSSWHFELSPMNPYIAMNIPAGYASRMMHSSNKTIDFVTIKGAGHMAPRDAPRKSLQMITNFIHSPKNASHFDFHKAKYANLHPTPLPLRSDYWMMIAVVVIILALAVIVVAVVICCCCARKKRWIRSTPATELEVLQAL